MIIPFRSKNPPEHFPVFTIGLIAINILIYLLTSYQNFFLQIDKGALNSFAVSHITLLQEPWRMVTAMFLHANLEHIIGNMLFLWIFGAASEGRLRPVRYLILYFAAGITGGLLSDLVQGVTSADTPSLGASGAIMGVAGAYLYMFPFARIRFVYIVPLGFFVRFGLGELAAMWIVAIYAGMDILFGILLHSADGVGHFAHLGGFATGLLASALLRARRDTQETSQAQALLDETKDYTLLGYSELEALLQNPTENMQIVLAFCEKSLTSGDPSRQQKAIAYLSYYAPRLFSQADPSRLAHILLTLSPPPESVPLIYYLRLGSRLEAITSNSLAVQIYRRIYDINPGAPDSEMALFRTAQIMLTAFNNREYARATFQEMLRLFPHGDMALQARSALQQNF